MESLRDVQQAIQTLAAQVGPNVVGLGQRWGIGSGVVIDKGRVLTNAHNVRGGEVQVTFHDGRTETGQVAGIDIDADLAVVTVDTKDAPGVRWSSNGTNVGLGAPVFALSNPGGRGLRATHGFVSGTERSFRGPRGRRIAGSIEHTAPLLPGSSGGPIVHAEGLLIGLNTNRLGEGFYLAIPADASLRERAEALARGEAPTRPRLGIGIVPSHVARHLRRAVGLPESDGLLVRQVEEGSAAEKAGLREGDLIVSAAGRPVKNADDLYDVLDGLKPGASLEVKVVRGTEERAVTVQIQSG